MSRAPRRGSATTARTSPARTWLRCGAGLLAGLVLGGAAAWAVWSLSADDRDPPMPPAGDRVTAAVEGVLADGVYVPPDGRRILDEAAERRIEDLVAGSDPRVAVVAWEATRDGGYRTVGDAAQEISLRANPGGVTVVWQGPGDGAVETPSGTLWPSVDFEGDPETRITEFLRDVDGERIEPREQPSAVGPTIGGIVLGLVAYVVLMLVVGLVRQGLGRPFVVAGPFAAQTTPNRRSR